MTDHSALVEREDLADLIEYLFCCDAMLRRKKPEATSRKGVTAYLAAAQALTDLAAENAALVGENKALRSSPPEEAWGGLARAIMMWLDFETKTPRTLFRHLKHSGVPIPQWLRDEAEMQALDHTPSKGTRVVLIYRAVQEANLAALERPTT
jgi:hypothetical protein